MWPADAHDRHGLPEWGGVDFEESEPNSGECAARSTFLTNLLRTRGLGRAFGVGRRLFDSVVVVLIEEGAPWLWLLHLNDDKTLFFWPRKSHLGTNMLICYPMAQSLVTGERSMF